MKLSIFYLGEKGLVVVKDKDYYKINNGRGFRLQFLYYNRICCKNCKKIEKARMV